MSFKTPGKSQPALRKKRRTRLQRRMPMHRYLDERVEMLGVSAADADPVMVLDAADAHTASLSFRVVHRSKDEPSADYAVKVRKHHLIISGPSVRQDIEEAAQA